MICSSVNLLRFISPSFKRGPDSNLSWRKLPVAGHLSSFISLLERSHLGEFSWPFSDTIRSIAENLLSETDLSGKGIRPILHVVADGGGYHIHNEIIPAYSTKRRLAV